MSLRANHFSNRINRPLIPRTSSNDHIVYGSNVFYGVPCTYRVLPMKLDAKHQKIFDELKPDPYQVYEGIYSDTELGRWEENNARIVASCCSEVVSYTYYWDQLYNRILRKGLVTPLVYNFVYLMTKIMENSQPIPVGTVLYRSSNTPFEDIPREYGVLSFSLSPTRLFGKYTARYVVPEGVVLKGVRFSQTAGLFENDEYEVVVGPGVYMANIKKEKGVDKKLHNGQNIYYDYVVDLAQEVPYTWFEDNLNPQLDDVYVDVVSVAEDNFVVFDQDGVTNIIYPPGTEWISEIRGVKINVEGLQDISNDESSLAIMSILYTQCIVGKIYLIPAHPRPTSVKTRFYNLLAYEVDGKLIYVGEYMNKYKDKKFSLDIGNHGTITFNGKEELII